MNCNGQRPNASILDVGCGSGYLCSVFAEISPLDARVFGIDYIQELVVLSENNLNNQNPGYIRDGKIELACADGWKGLPSAAPFDVIHVGAAARSMPRDLLLQLKAGGRMIIPVGVEHQELFEVDRLSDSGPLKNQFQARAIMGVRYVTLVVPPGIRENNG